MVQVHKWKRKANNIFSLVGSPNSNKHCQHSECKYQTLTNALIGFLSYKFPSPIAKQKGKCGYSPGPTLKLQPQQLSILVEEHDHLNWCLQAIYEWVPLTLFAFCLLNVLHPLLTLFTLCTMESGLPLFDCLLQQTLRGICSSSNSSSSSKWVYAVFWRIVPRNFPPPRWVMNMARM